MTLIQTIAAPPGQECVHVKMNPGEEAYFLEQQAAAQEAQNAVDVKAKIQAALLRSDMVALRCMKDGIVFPDEWKTYVAALRGGALPVQPEYPV